ncbi:MAG: PIG-L family deacetylase [Candidatus Promineifilaceae bacterium]|nr:PIG-L family deacetylase [Candidatus Promineifilaceae bacterium]
MVGAYDAVYLAPHLDDVALSCGALVYEQTQAGQQVLIVSLMAGDPPQEAVSLHAQRLHTRWQLAANVAAARRAEDRAACAVLGADHLHWQLPDCIYRHNPDDGRPLYPSDAALFGTVHPAEKTLIDEIAARLGRLPPHERLYVPLGVGGHVDHRLTRAAAEKQFDTRSLTYYEEYPYILQPEALEKAQDGGTGWCSERLALSAAAVVAKIEAIACYQSQLSTFFADRDDLKRQIENHARVVGGVRLWQRC